MQILFLHNNFPAQFGNLGLYLKNQGWDVWYGTQRKKSALAGLKVFNYAPHRTVSEKTHPYVTNFENAVLNGQAVAREALKLKTKGLAPDVVVAHSGWGPGLFAKDIWPQAKFVGYFEWFYWPNSPDVEFLNDDTRSLDDALRGRARNASILTELTACDIGLCPTQFQHQQLPACFHDKIHVLHDGIDTEKYIADRTAKLKFDDLDLSSVDEIVTYVARGMEPYRGFPQFMAALAELQKRRPAMHAVIVGEDRVAYGKKLEKGDSYKQRALKDHDLDPARTHFTGLLPRNRYLEVLQASSVHLYLTIPFVLSWSMMEAMSAECALVASNNAPVQELITDGEHGVLVDLNDTADIVRGIDELLDDPARRLKLGAAARARIVEKYAAADLMSAKRDLFASLLAPMDRPIC